MNVITESLKEIHNENFEEMNYTKINKMRSSHNFLSNIKKLVISFFILQAILSLNTVDISAAAQTNAEPQVSTSSTPKDKIIQSKETTRIVLKVKSKTANVNNKKVTLSHEVVMRNNKVFVPLNFLTGNLGAQSTYNSKSKTVTITKGAKKIVLQIGKSNATVNGKKTFAGASPYRDNSIVMIPVKFVGEQLGAKYQYSSKNNTVTLSRFTDIIKIPNNNLHKAIKKTLNITSGDIRVSDVEKITTLVVSDTNISNLEGIQYLKNLKALRISSAKLKNIEPLGKLSKLEYLVLFNNNIKDVSPLNGLKNLYYLDLSYNNIESIDILGNLPALQSLNLNNNRIKDITYIKNFSKLRSVNLSVNPIADPKPLESLSELSYVRLWDLDSLEKINQVNKKADEIISSVIKEDMSDYEKELALYDYIISHAKYDIKNYDKGSIPLESHNPYGILIKGVGVCDGYAYSLQILLSKCGIDNLVVFGKGNSLNGWEGHAWNMVKINGEYFHIDATFDDPVTQDNRNMLRHMHFNLSDKQMSINHTWEKEDYPKCTVDNKNFSLLRSDNKIFVVNDSYYFSIIKDYIYKVSFDGSSSKKICDDKAADFIVADKWIYFINLSDNSSLYKIALDGSSKEKLVNKSCEYISFADNWIYYLSDHRIYKINSSGDNNTLICREDAITYFTIYNNQIYYRGFDWSTDSGHLYKINFDSTEKTKVTEDAIIGFTIKDEGTVVEFIFGRFEYIVDDWVYYISQNDGNKLCKVKTDGTDKITLTNRSAENIELLDDYLYFLEKGTGKYYKVKTDGTGEILVG